MGRNRKDSTGSDIVDHYRQQIAKQDSKKNRQNLKSIRFQSDKKESTPTMYKDISIMVGALLLLCFFLYCMFIALLSTQKLKEDQMH